MKQMIMIVEIITMIDKKTIGIITKITPQYAFELNQARLDEAIVTGRPLIERPFHYENANTGQEYYDIVGCIGWPAVITDKTKANNKPGYLAVVGIVKKDGAKPEDAKFQLLDEAESQSIHKLFTEMVRLRQLYGFGLFPGLMQTWTGDSDRFIEELALFNETLTVNGGERMAVLIGPPNDFQDTKKFDVYIRATERALDAENQRLFFGRNNILRNRIKEFMDKDPVIMAIGGLLHTLYARASWLDQARENVFNVDEDT